MTKELKRKRRKRLIRKHGEKWNMIRRMYKNKHLYPDSVLKKYGILENE